MARNPEQSRHDAILEVAIRHFAEQSYDDVSTVAIATEAGVNRGWIHHEFGSKHDLYLAVLRQVITVPTLPRLPEVGSLDDLEPALWEMTDAWLDDVAAHREPYLAAQRVAFGLSSDQEIQKLIAEVRERTIDEALTVMLPDPSTATPALRALVSCVGALSGQALAEWLERGRLSRDQAQALIVNMTLSMWRDIERITEPHPRSS